MVLTGLTATNGGHNMSFTDYPEETVTITRAKYNDLLDDARWRACVEGAGVDNWDGFDWAMEEYYGDNDE